MSYSGSFFASELYRYYLQSGKTVSDRVLRVLDKPLSELTDDERETYEALIAPSVDVIKNALKDGLGRPGADKEQWREQLRNSARSIIGQIAAELFIEMGIPAGPVVVTSQRQQLTPAPPEMEASPPEPPAGQPAQMLPEQHQPSLSPKKKTPEGFRKNLTKKVFAILYWAFFAVIALFLVLLVLSLFNLGVQAFAVSSGSMSPSIEAGSIVFVRSSGEYAVGDVITFRLEENVYTTHRVHEIREEDGAAVYVTKGDANQEVDAGLIREDQIEGKVVLTLPYLGYVVAFLRTLPGFILIMSVFGLLIVSLLWDIIREILSHDKPGKVESGKKS